MKSLPRLRHWLRALFHRSQFDAELAEELAFHLQAETERNLAAGLPPAAARQAAAREFGGTDQVKEQCRDEWSLASLSQFARDLRLGCRGLRKRPGFAVVVIATLALGIGVNTAVFSIINATFLHPLPYAEADRLMFLMEQGGSGELGVSYPDFLDWGAQQHAFAGLALYHPDSAKLTTAESTDLVSVCEVSADFFSVLGISTVQGRTLMAADDRVGAAPVVWVTQAAWQRYFAADPTLVGKTIRLDGQTVAVVGILPASFRFHRNVDFFRPLAPYAAQRFMTMRVNHTDAFVLGRLDAGVTLEAARAQMTTIAGRLEHDYPNEAAGVGVRVLPLRDRLAGPARNQLLLLFGAVGMVLLITCLNVANLQLSRSLAREREMAIRTALGASRGQLIRQLLAESLVLATGGGLAGLALGVWGTEFARQLIPWEMRSLADTVGLIEPRVFLFIAGATLFTGFGIGIAPAWRLSHVNPNQALKNQRRMAPTWLGRLRLSDLLVVAQVALALVLLISAGLLVRSLHRLLLVPSGIRAERVLTLRLTPPTATFQADPFGVTRFYDRIVGAVGALPEVEVAAAVTGLPFTWNISTMDFYLDGRPIPEQGKFPSASRHTVSAGYFRAIGIPLLRGRTFDGHERQPVIPAGLDLSLPNFAAIYKDIVFDGVISQSLAQQFWPGEDALGKRFRLGGPELHGPWVQVIGIVGNTTQLGLDQGVATEFYLSIRQFPTPEGFVVVRTRGDPEVAAASVRAAIHRVASDEPIQDLQPMASRMAGFVSDRRFNMDLFAGFAAIALVLALLGIYGVLSFFVSQRTREMGLRMALGAQRHDVIREIFGRGLWLAVAGLVLGIAGAWGVSRLLQSQLFGVSPTDPVAYLAAAALLLLATLGACYGPARRATQVDPMVALRTE